MFNRHTTLVTIVFIDATIRLSILATLGYKLNNKEIDELATAIQDIVKAEVMTAYNVGKHDALDNIEITSEEYYKQKYQKK